jgi:antitoxin YefM
MNAIKYRAVVKNGMIEMPIINLPEGTIVEAIFLIEPKTQVETDETAYLLSTEANRRNLLEGLEELKQSEKYI